MARTATKSDYKKRGWENVSHGGLQIPDRIPNIQKKLAPFSQIFLLQNCVGMLC